MVSGGGSGHLPLFGGYVGHGLIDTCAIGKVFEGPALHACLEATRPADGGAGILQLIGN
ncbi:dihydroxyacetone kinase subunit DhaK [Mesorhizobium sp. M0520]|uniref:dihydroxyacetone kinase subunit DhaK n=1 Tax=Mesorhizobium sp. M0520 TaxID=2956957 RepID=UPI00333C4FFB